MMSVGRIARCVVFVLSLPQVLAGCGGITDYVPQPVVLHDTSPAQLDSVLAVTMGGYDPATRDATELHVGFSSQGHPVQFVADERVVCNDVALRRVVGSFDATVPTAAVAGKPLACTYTSGQSSAALTVTVPAAPAILAPQDGERVPRAAQTVVRFSAPAGTISGPVALAHASKAVPEQGPTGSTQALLDTRPLSAGAGSIVLTDFLVMPDAPNPGFKSLLVRGEAMTMVAVTWV